MSPGPFGKIENKMPNSDYRKVLNRVRTLLRNLIFLWESNRVRTVFESGLYLFLPTPWRFFKDDNQQTWCPWHKNLPF